MEPSLDPVRVEDIVLVRLLAAPKKGLSEARTMRDLGFLFEHRLGPGDFRAVLDRLRAARLVLDDRLEVTEDGKRRALRFLGVDRLPRGDWRAFRSRLVRLGLRASVNKLDEGSLAALLVCEAHGLPACASVNRVAIALLCNAFGLEHTPRRTVKSVITQLAVKASSAPRSDAEDYKDVVLARLAQAKPDGAD